MRIAIITRNDEDEQTQTANMKVKLADRGEAVMYPTKEVMSTRSVRMSGKRSISFLRNAASEVM